jgi:putative membrane protein
MKILANFLIALIALIALEHIGIAVMEMFFWTTPIVYENFDLTREEAILSAPLAANQGLYNGFLAAGLLWGLRVKQERPAIVLFFLTCVLVAGIFGAATVKQSILWVQAAPATIACFCAILELRLSKN